MIQSSLLDHRHLLVLPYHCWSSFLLLTIKTMVLCIIVFSSHFLLDLNLWMFWISAVFSLVETIPLSNLSIMMDQLHMLATKFLNLRASFLMSSKRSWLSVKKSQNPILFSTTFYNRKSWSHQFTSWNWNIFHWCNSFVSKLKTAVCFTIFSFYLSTLEVKRDLHQRCYT